MLICNNCSDNYLNNKTLFNEYYINDLHNYKYIQNNNKLLKNNKIKKSIYNKFNKYIYICINCQLYSKTQRNNLIKCI